MLAPVLITKDGEPFMLPYNNALADNFLDAYVIGVKTEINTGWQFTNTLIDVNVAHGIHAQYEGMVVVHLNKEEYAGSEG